MAPSSELGSPGTSTYSSNILNVGDGTWDTQRNTFLLPNLMGVNFEMMQYNGMGNRFRNMDGYHSLIKAHGILGAITFLGIVPAAILIARFYSKRPYWALRLHIWMHIMTLLLSTVIFILGWFAVGPKRSLTNPHHGIGLAIYVLVITQTLWGWLVHKRLKGKRRTHLPLKLMLHHWLGRTIAILGIVQIPLGLTLYGSPLSLFILFALAAFALLVIYFILSYLHERSMGADHDSRGTYSTGPDTNDGSHGHGKFGRLAAAGAAGAGLAMLGRRLRGRSRSRSPVDDMSDRTPYTNEKDSDEDRHGGGWGKRLFQFGTAAGAAGLAKKFFDKRRDRESDAESGRYHPAHTATDSRDDDSISRLEYGRPPRHSRRAYDGPPSAQQSGYTESDITGPEERSHGLRNAVLGAGAFTALKGLFKSSNKQKEDRRVEELRRVEEENERIARANSRRRYTGDGPPRRNDRRHSPISDITPTDPDMGLPYSSVHPPPHDDMSDTGTVTPIGRKHRKRPSTAGVGTGVSGAGYGEPSGHRRRSGNREGSFDSEPSQPLSIKVKTHNHGRRVTLRQLTKDEVNADREARRKERSRPGRHGRDHSIAGNDSDDHWRRVENLERRQAEGMQHEPGLSTIAPSQSGIASPEPMPPPSFAPSGPLPPPPVPLGHSALNSPGTISTDLSGSYASRSGRRRAERRVARHGRQASVEFT